MSKFQEENLKFTKLTGVPFKPASRRREFKSQPSEVVEATTEPIIPLVRDHYLKAKENHENKMDEAETAAFEVNWVVEQYLASKMETEEVK